MNKKNEDMFGKFYENTVLKSAKIGEVFYMCNITKHHDGGTFSEQQWFDFIYLGTDNKVIKVRVHYEYDENNKLNKSWELVLELPLNDEKEALFEPEYLSEMPKSFLIKLIDEFGHIEITINQRKK